MPEHIVDLDIEVGTFVPVSDRIAPGALGIRRRFASTMRWLFAVTNLFVLGSLGIVFWQDRAELAAAQIRAVDRIIDAHVVIALLVATTVQLGAVIYTMARAIFPTSSLLSSN